MLSLAGTRKMISTVSKWMKLSPKLTHSIMVSRVTFTNLDPRFATLVPEGHNSPSEQDKSPQKVQLRPCLCYYKVQMAARLPGGDKKAWRKCCICMLLHFMCWWSICARILCIHKTRFAPHPQNGAAWCKTPGPDGHTLDRLHPLLLEPCCQELL